jgi:AcrR family transcriptional regulator
VGVEGRTIVDFASPHYHAAGMPPGRVRAEQKAATRAALLRAARRLFVAPGYFSTGTEDLVAESKVGTRGALYHHFADKRALFEAAFDEVIAEFSAASAAAAHPAVDALESVHNGLRCFLAGAADDPEVQRIILIDGPSVLGWDRWRAKQEQYGVGLISEMLQVAVADGVIAAQPVDALAHLLLALVDDAALFIAYSDEPATARADMGVALDNLVSGLRRTRR